MRKTLSKVIKGIKNPELILRHFKLKALKKNTKLSDIEFLKRKYKLVMGKDLNLDNPKTFNEKLQWLKIYWRDDRATICADKYRVREYVKEKGCEEILNDLYGVWDNADDIDFDKLPNSFVLKANHGCGYNIFIKDKTQIDIKKIKKELNKILRQKFYIKNREWVYEGIKPKIIAEKLFDIENGFPKDYKFYCFQGETKLLLVVSDRGNDTKFDFFDMEFNHLDIKKTYKNSNKEIKKPEKFKKMIEYAKKLSEDFPFVRVDFYEIEGKVIFGELTFFPGSGMEKFEPEEWDYKFGELLKLPEVKYNG